MGQDFNNELETLNRKDYYKPKTIIPKYLIDRDVLNQESVIKETGYEARDKSVIYSIREIWFELNILNIFKNLLPILQWLPQYSVRKHFVGDLIAGLTVAVMHIPQGLAYGLLAGVTSEVGLYMAFFPVLVYIIFGTSRHISMGTFAVISLMTLKVVQNHATITGSNFRPHSEVNFSQVNANSSEILTQSGYSPIQVVTATAVMVGIFHILMGIARLGVLASLLSEPLVNGFTTAAAVHVIVTQIKDILGITVPRHKGAFKIIYTLIDYGKEINNTNIFSLIFSFGIIIFMTFMNEIAKPWFSKKYHFPLPVELLAVVGGTIISRFMEIGPNQNVKLVGDIPLGLPPLTLPPISILPAVALDSIAIAIVSYSVVMSMALIFAKKHSYEVNANQELFALGIANIVGGLFSCIPLACSLSRSLIQEQTGGVTQIASVISAFVILMILLFVGPFFNTLPRCVLAGVIIVALKGMFMQAKELKKFMKQGKLEPLTWIVTFLSVIVIDIDLGLLMGLVISSLGVYIKGCKPYSSLLGTSHGTGIYVDIKYHKNALEVPKIKIFRYVGSVNFATRASFKKVLYNQLEIDHEKLRKASSVSEKIINGKSECNDVHYHNHFYALIIDLSALAHIDYAGCRTFTEIFKEMAILNVQVYLTSPSDTVYDNLVHSIVLGEGPFYILPSIHDAVLFAQANPPIL